MTTPDKPLLEVRDLCVSFETDEGVLPAVDGVSFTVNEGETLGIVGESGCGKSVTALSLLRLIPCPPGKIAGGEVLFRGENLLALPSHELASWRGKAISMIFQEPMNALSPLLQIGRQLVETAQTHRSLSQSDAEALSVEWLRKVGIPDPLDRMRNYPHQLSGGMLQRIMIAMALMLHPALIIADEPTTALDVTIQAQIFALMKSMKERQTAMILITHDMGAIWEMCDRVAVMYAGRIVEINSVEALFAHPRHPYTQALLQSMPTLVSARGPLIPIPGSVPSPLAYPKGCRFRDRCPFAFDRCADYPPLYRLPDGAQAACFLVEKEGLSP